MIVLNNGLKLELDHNSFTACIVHSQAIKGDIFVPSSIEYSGEIYYITSIKECSFRECRINSIIFPQDSYLCSIKNEAFEFSNIQYLQIPASVESIRDLCFSYVKSLINIEISPQNKNFTYFDPEHKLIGGKSNKNQKEFDVLQFACRDIIHVEIPLCVKKICPFSFYYCTNLQNVLFSEDSLLISIGDYAFASSSIVNIIFPKELRYIGKNAFFSCNNISKVQFKEPSSIETFSNSMFESASIYSLYIPSSVKYFEEKWLKNACNLNEIQISPKNDNFMYFDQKIVLSKSDNSKNNYDTIFFALRNINNIQIPSFIKKIAPYAFSFCKNLKSVSFSNDSKLKKIDKYAFSSSGIQTISFPPTLSDLGEYVFYFCDHLKYVDFSKKSSFKTIKENSFYYSMICELTIPDNVSVLENGWCANCAQLEKINVSSNNKNFVFVDNCFLFGKSDNSKRKDDFDTILFANRKIQRAEIPSTIRFINSNAFEKCSNMHTVEIKRDSELLVIGDYSFSESGIMSIFIPKGVKEIGFNAFSSCPFLETVDFDVESVLKSIQMNKFTKSNIKRITIPDSVDIDTTWWYDISTLIEIKIIKISPNNPLMGYLDDDHKLIGKKSNEKYGYYDKLIFACRNIKNAVIPSYVVNISDQVFAYCSNLKCVEFSKDSRITNLNSSFNKSSIKSIIVPKNVNEINSYEFCDCNELKSIEFLSNYNLFIPEKSLPQKSKVVIISFPNAKHVFFESFHFNQSTRLLIQANGEII